MNNNMSEQEKGEAKLISLYFLTSKYVFNAQSHQFHQTNVLAGVEWAQPKYA